MLEALRPNQVLSSLVQRAITQLQTVGEEHTFTFLHLRIEDDWLGHCYRWSHYPVRTVQQTLVVETSPSTILQHVT